jgi:hypothetical protein
MKLYPWIRSASSAVVLALACLLSISARAQAPQVISLEPPTGWELQTHIMDSKGTLLPPAPPNFRRLGEATTGELADLHTITLRFNETTRISKIAVSKDFKVEQGGSCVAGNVYEAKGTCTLLVRFTPQGAGNRLGSLTISNSASATPMAFGLGGYGYSPIVSFTPSVINTVPGSYPSSVGLLSAAQNLAVDGSDTVWIADSGNKVIRYLDSSGIFKTLTTTTTAPLGITVDTFGQAYFDEPSANTMHEIYDYGPVVQVNGTGTIGCPASTPCNLNSEGLGSPGMMSTDGYNNLFFVDSHSGAAMATVQPLPAKLIFLYDPFPFQTNPSSAMAVDRSDNLYSLWANGGVCSINQQSLYNAENSNVSFIKVAGGHTCGYSGDGGLAGNAELGSLIGQIAFDTAGDMYFSDTQNQRVRRIDNITGIIRTIAGNGVAGYTLDGGNAQAAEISSPTGVAVDSQGQVYIISSAASGQVIRKVGPQGYRNFQNVMKGARSAPFVTLITNTGNTALTITGTAFTGTNASDFSIDPTTTSCLLTPGSTLYSGQTCQIGLIMTPSAIGTRSGTFILLDNTATNSNSIILTGTGNLPAPTFTITSPANGASFTSGTPITLTASVTSTSGTAPTGTVQFQVDGANYGGAVTISSGTASTSVTGLTQTTHTLGAKYSGDVNYSAAGPITVSITVTAVKPLVTLVPMLKTTTSCLPMSFQVTVAGKTGTVPTGTVQLLDGTRGLATGALANGSVVLTVAPLLPGMHSLTARYGGDAHDQPAVSPVLDEIISQSGGCFGPPVGGVPIH